MTDLPDPKAQLVERIRAIWAGNIVRHEMFDELASAWIEDVEKARLDEETSKNEALGWAKANVVKWSNDPEHDAIGIGWVISSIDAMTHKSSERIARLRSGLTNKPKDQ